ncbi:MAG TPA: Pycsar system effector family protein [Flavisolibacter sp.]|nr:Pycsar system effector family protein [Flavisolibacter sp.]
MNEQQLQLLTQVRAYVTEIFRQKVDSHFVFHNLEHTQQVIAAAEELAAHYNLNDEDRLILLLAAWFHDTGFSSGRAEDHEKESIRLATEFLHQKHVDNETIQRVSSCIQATRMPQSPLSLVEKIMCDADLYHLGSNDYKKINEHLRQEQEFYFKTEFSKKEWRQRNIEFLESHQYFTDFAQRLREPKKQEWIRDLRRKQGDKGIKHTEAMEISPYSFQTELEYGSAGSMGGKPGRPNKEAERGIQTVFRTTSNNHIQLSQMADTKANIMISVNAIIISIMFSVLLGRLEYYPHLAIPTLLLAVVSLLAIVFAVLAIRPSVTTGKFTEDDIRSKKTNLLFFGNFHQMELEEYNWAMNEMLKDREYIYGSMIKDVYFLGIVLAQKYRYLRISYNIFMYGLIVAVIAFGISTFWGA